MNAESTVALEKKMQKEHYEKYEEKYDQLGKGSINQLVLSVVSLDTLVRCLPLDKNLNNVALHKWDRCHPKCVQMVRFNGGGVWSMSDTVCVTKHAACEMVKAAHMKKTEKMGKHPVPGVTG